MTQRRQPPRKAGAEVALGRATTPETKRFSPASVFIVSHFHRLRESLCRRLCPDLLFNSDMSLEIGTLHIEIDRLRERIRELEGQRD